MDIKLYVRTYVRDTIRYNTQCTIDHTSLMLFVFVTLTTAFLLRMWIVDVTRLKNTENDTGLPLGWQRLQVH